jgi:membrane-associated phospholipid phosphatase
MCRHRVSPLLMSASFLVVVAAVRAWLQWRGPLPGDRYAETHFARPWTEAEVIQKVASVFAALGTPLVATALLVLSFVLLCVYADLRTAGGLMLAALVIPLNALLKRISGPTPLWIESHQHPGLNFPSGHVAFVTSVLGYLTLIAVRQRRRPLAWAGALIIVGIGPARVVAGAHLVSDVLAGYLVGGAALVLAGRGCRLQSRHGQASRASSASGSGEV